MKSKFLGLLTLLCLAWSSAFGQYLISIPLSARLTVTALKQNIAYTGPIQVTGGDQHNGVTCAKTSGSFPTGLSLSGCSIQGTPSGSSSATAVVTITDSSSQTYLLTVILQPATLSSITVSATATTVTIGATQQYTAAGNWSDSTSNDLTNLGTWSSTDGTVATVSAAGVATGAGAGSASIRNTFSAVIGSLGITVSSSSPVISNPSSLPNAQQGLPYSPYQITASGGTLPYTNYAVTVGSLPLGLVLSATTGVISGTVTGTTQTFTVRVTDSATNTGTKSLTITVATASSNAVSCNPTTFTVGSTSQCTSTTTFSDGSPANTTNGSGLTRVNSTSASNATGTTVTSMQTPAFNAVGGNLLIVGSRHGTDFVSAITVTDTAGNTFTPIGSLTVNSPNLGVAQMFYAKNITGNAADRVTCTFAGSVAYDNCVVLQQSGADTSAPLDVHNETSNTSATNNCASGTFTTTSANEALVESCNAASINAVFSPGAGYTVENTDPDGLGAIEDSIVSSTQTGVTATMSFNGPAKQTITLLGTFKAGSSTGATWSTSTPSICSVNGMGVITGLGVGTCTVSATFGGFTGSASPTVQSAPVTSITVTPASVSGPQNATQQFIAKDQSGNDITSAVVWSSNLTSCVTISSSGLAVVVSSTACGTGAQDIVATMGQVNGTANFAGTGTQQTQGLLSGCTVASNNTPSCPTPAGWTLSSAVSFEDNTLGGGAPFKTNVPTTIVSNFGHTGTHSWQGLLSGDNKTFAWGGPSLAGTYSTYISFWEWDDPTALENSELSLGGVDWNGLQFTAMDMQNTGSCGNSTLGNNPKANMIFVFGGSAGPTGSGQAPAYQSACIPQNSPSWGNWTQWEMLMVMNTPTALGQTSNAQYKLYENGVLISQMLPFSGACSSQTFACSNLSGSTDLGAAFHQVFIGGINTDIVAWQDAAKTICSTNGSPVQAFSRPSDANSISPCPLQEPPNGYWNNTVPGGFHRYFDDIIVLKK